VRDLISDEKVERLIKDDKIFLLYDTDMKDTYLVKGNKDVYTVTYDKLKETYSCSCGNVRPCPCYHIKGLIRYQKGEQNESKDISMGPVV
jgi:hypothetical protein